MRRVVLDGTGRTRTDDRLSMFDIGWGEFLVIGTVALVVIGPKELPGVLRTVGQTVGKIRRMASEFQGQFQEALREADLDDARKTISGLNDSTSSFNPIQTIRDEIKGAVDGAATSPNPPALTTTAEATAEPLRLDIPEPPPVPDLTPEQIRAAFVTEPLGAAAPDAGVVAEVAAEKPKRSRKKAAPAEPPAATSEVETAAIVEAKDNLQDEAPAKPARRRQPRKAAAAKGDEGGEA
jgi:sec-independent protein translocase protein TatB